MKHMLMAITVFFTSLNLQAQIKKAELINSEVFQYQKTEFYVFLKASWSNPYAFNEIALDMILISPSGKQLSLPCFYESGNSGNESVWKARFAPREAGVYSYQFKLMENGKMVSSTPENECRVKSSKGKGFLNQHDSWTLRYDNGEFFRGIGENICWESRDEDDSKYFEALHEDKRFNYDYMLKKLAANGGNFFRTWMIYWNLPVDWQTVSNNSRYRNTTATFNESGMKRLDWLVTLCDSLGIHMMLALESHVGFMGDGWKMSRYNIANGGYASKPVEFFTLPEAKLQYKNKLRLMIARYGYSPSIGAWEFFNEIDNAMYQGKPEDRIPDQVITAWHEEMSIFLKSTDPYKHLVTTSVSHRDVQGMNDLENIDFNQKHMYKNTAAIPETIHSYTQQNNKPYVIGEYGYEWDWSKNFNDFADDMDGDFKRGLWLGLFNPTPVLPLSWWWEFFESRGMMGYFKLVSEMNRKMLIAGKGKFESFDVKAATSGIQAYGVRCGKQNFIYLYNSTDINQSIRLTGIKMGKLKGKLTCFDGETGKYSIVEFEEKPGEIIEINGPRLQPKGNIILSW